MCLYDEAGWDNKVPEHAYWSYGPHRPYEEYGHHMLVNNQTGGATMTLCEGADGTECFVLRGAPHTVVAQMTPYNSIKLAP